MSSTWPSSGSPERQVALKIIKPGIDTREVITRRLASSANRPNIWQGESRAGDLNATFDSVFETAFAGLNYLNGEFGG